MLGAARSLAPVFLQIANVSLDGIDQPITAALLLGYPLLRDQLLNPPFVEHQELGNGPNVESRGIRHRSHFSL